MGLKRLAQKAVYRLGLPAVAGTLAYDLDGARGGLEIFFGHQVAPTGTAAPALAADHLYDRLRYLCRTRDVVSLEEGVRWLQQPRRGDRLAALTFDDGYEDNLINLLPVLESAAVPATVFVATQPVVEGGRLWFEAVRSALAASGGPPQDLEWLPAPDTEQLMAALQQCPPPLRRRRVDEVLERLPQACRVSNGAARPLTGEQLQRLASHPLVSIGAHTHSHTVLSACDLATAEEELQTNLHLLERLTGRRPVLFAYPRGRDSDFSPAHCDLLARLGVRAAVTTVGGRNVPGTDVYALMRIPLAGGGVERFAWSLECRSLLASPPRRPLPESLSLAYQRDASAVARK